MAEPTGKVQTRYLSAETEEDFRVFCNPPRSQRTQSSTDIAVHLYLAFYRAFIIFWRGADNNIYALYTIDGSLRWQYATTGPVRGSAGFSSDGYVGIGSDDGYFYYLETATGVLSVSGRPPAGPFSCTCVEKKLMLSHIPLGPPFPHYCSGTTTRAPPSARLPSSTMSIPVTSWLRVTRASSTGCPQTATRGPHTPPPAASAPRLCSAPTWTSWSVRTEASS